MNENGRLDFGMEICVCLYKGQGKPSDEEMETKWSSDGDR
jgi:hypothetical protein